MKRHGFMFWSISILMGTAVYAAGAQSAGYVMPLELAQYFSQSKRLRHISVAEMAQRFTPKIEEYFTKKIPLLSTLSENQPGPEGVSWVCRPL